MPPVSYKNSVLNVLDPETIKRLRLRRVKFELNHEIEFPGELIEHIFFVEEGMASMTVTFQDGFQVEVGMFGYESIIGVSALMGTKRSLNRIYTQIAGNGYSSPLALARAEFARDGRFQRLALRYVQAQLVQTAQSAACNARHEIDRRLARWLLICADRAHSNTFFMPHEYLRDMLGCSRPSVSVAAKVLKDKKLISYTRTVIKILDSKGLEKAACECYHVIKNHLDNYTEFDSSIVS